MNKQDKVLIVIVLVVSIIALFVIYLTKNIKDKVASIYYDNKKVLEIDLSSSDEKTYIVNGYNGAVKILFQNHTVQVVEENSPLHLCSKQPPIKESYESIICLPNKIIIKIESKDSLDAIVE